jgi:hypothetical protein
VNTSVKSAAIYLRARALDRFDRSMTGNLTDVLELDRIGVTVVSVRVDKRGAARLDSIR